MAPIATAICDARVPRISLSTSYTTIDTIAMSRRSHHVTGGRSSSESSQGMIGRGSGPGARSRGRSPRRASTPALTRGPRSVPEPCSRIISATRATCTISATAWTRTICAPPSTAAVTAAAVAQSRSAAGAPPAAAARNDLREGPTSTGRPSAARAASAGQRGQAVLGPLGEAQARVDDDLLPGARRGSPRARWRGSARA